VSTELELEHSSPWTDPFRLTVDDLLSEIRNQPRVIDGVLEASKERLRAALDRDAIKNVRRIYITGCGDSYYAGLAARFAMERWTGISVEPIEAMEFARYHAEAAGPDSALIAISNSGKAMRTVEAAAAATRHGLLSIAVTGNDASPLADAARVILNQQVKRDGVSLTMPANLEGKQMRGFFGMANYVATLTMLFAFAAYVGEIRGHRSTKEAENLRDSVRRTAETIAATIESLVGPAEHLAKETPVCEPIFIGSGPSHASALFFAAKMYELPRVNASSSLLEEWAHEQFFITSSKIMAFFIAPPGRSESRALELMPIAKQFGATTVAVTEVGSCTAALADLSLLVAGTTPEELTPFVYCVPAQLYAAFLAQERGRPAFAFDNWQQKQMNERSIQNSAIWREEETVAGR
jgi:glutamine---fructose-6-phosphate transaminase (isomerizing)